MDDLIDADFGKHDYDWLLTPPESPLVPAAHVSDHKVTSTVSSGRSTARSVSTARASRVSASQLQNGQSTKPPRSSSLTRSSYISSSVNGNNRTSVLCSSTASIISRPSTASKHSTPTRTPPSSLPLTARSQTPAKSRPAPASPCAKTAKPQNFRSSTPTSRPLISTGSNSHSVVTPSSPRLHSQPSTPTRKLTSPLPPAAATGRATSVGCARNPAASSMRSSSPSSRMHAAVQPVDIADFPSNAPPNLRTRLPERPSSACRARPGAALTSQPTMSSNNAVSAGPNRRYSLPAVGHSKFSENPPKDEIRSIRHLGGASERQKSVANRVVGATESTGFGRNMSKASLDMALRHMDIRQSIGGIRGTSLIPHSIRSNAPKTRQAHMSDVVVPVLADDEIASPNGEGPVHNSANLVTNKSPQLNSHITSERGRDPYGSYRYDAMLLKEDSKNMSWLHSAEDKPDESPVFDHRFEPLPEPFGLL